MTIDVDDVIHEEELMGRFPQGDEEYVALSQATIQKLLRLILGAAENTTEEVAGPDIETKEDA